MSGRIFTLCKEKSIGALGEMALLKRISGYLQEFPQIAQASPRGIGDDCAVLPCCPEELEFSKKLKRLVTTDSLIYGKHFDDSVSALDAGRKLIRRNVSDIAAMGGTPQDAVLAIVAGADLSAEWFEDFYRGLCQECERFRIELSGGDLASAPNGFFSATLSLTGFSEQPLLRSTAKVGDLFFVTGTLGGSILKKHFSFEPRLAEGQFLASLPVGTITSCIDLTDGLKKDVFALLPAGTHAEFYLEAFPISEDAITLGGNAIERAFCDGEDYELLFTVNPSEEKAFLEHWTKNFPHTPIAKIGKILPGEKAFLYCSGNAYEHFGKQE